MPAWTGIAPRGWTGAAAAGPGSTLAGPTGSPVAYSTGTSVAGGLGAGADAGTAAADSETVSGPKNSLAIRVSVASSGNHSGTAVMASPVGVGIVMELADLDILKDRECVRSEYRE